MSPDSADCNPPPSSSSPPSPAPSSPPAELSKPWNRIQTRYRWAWCFLCVMVWGSILSLDRLLTYSFQTLAANSFQRHSSLSFISLIRSVVAALAGPPFAILEELAGSPFAWLAALASYAAGHALTGASWGVPSFTAGITLYELGANGLVILQQILVAKITSSRDRQLFLVLPQLGFLVWAFISSRIFSALQDTWRWGVAMFAIMGPVALLPLVALLYYTPSSSKSKQVTEEDERLCKVCLTNNGSSSSSPSPSTGASHRPFQQWLLSLMVTCSRADMLGLLLLGSGTAGILVPIILAGQNSGWLKPHVLAPLMVSGLLILPAFIVWQLRCAPHPLIPRSLFRSRTFLFGALAEIIFQAAFAGSAAYLPTYLYVVKGTSAGAQQNVSSTFSFAYALGCLPIAFIARYTRRAKYIVVAGSGLYVIGSAVFVLTKSLETPTLFRIIVSQVLMGFGGSASMALIPAMVQIDAQRRWLASSRNDDSVKKLAVDQVGEGGTPATSLSASVALLNSDVGKAIAALNICQSLGAAVGNAIAGTLWTRLIPTFLDATLTPIGLASEIPSIFSAPLTWIESNPLGTESRNAVISVYNRLWRVLMITFTVLLACSVVASLLIENLVLDDEIGHSQTMEAEVISGKAASDQLSKPSMGEQKPQEEELLLLGQTIFPRLEKWYRSWILRCRGNEYPHQILPSNCAGRTHMTNVRHDEHDREASGRTSRT